MSSLWVIPQGGVIQDRAEVRDANPIPIYQPEDDSVERSQPPIAGRARAAQIVIPGIGTGAAYADGDCFGTIMEFPGLLRASKRSGLIHTASYFDLDDEGLQIDLHFFNRSIASPGADNAAFNPSDASLLAYIGTASFTAFSNFGSNQVSSGAYYIAVPPQTGTSIWAHAVTRAALNIAAENLPQIRIVVLPD